MRRPPACLALAFIAPTLLIAVPAGAQSTPPTPSSKQPSLPSQTPPSPAAYAPPKPGSPVVQSLVGSGKPALVVHKHLARERPRHHRFYARHVPVPLDLERPALAGVTLLQPLPPVPPPPHDVVPVPAYPLETVAAAFLTPPPQIVCHRTRRIRDLPDPRLYREETLACEPDNP